MATVGRPRMRIAAALLVLAPAAMWAPASAPPAPLRVTVAAGGLTDEVGTAVPTGPRRVLTAAHVLAGARAIHVGSRPARVVLVDPRLDLAVLDVPGLQARGLRYGSAGGSAEVHVLRDGRPRAIPARVRRSVTVALKDPRTGRTDARPALELAADVAPGDSGAPVTDGRGRVVGIVFARGVGRPATTWAVDVSTTAAQLR